MTYAVTKKHFKIFKKEFLKWRDFWGLTEYKLYFHHRSIGENYGECHTNLDSSHATITLSDKWDKLYTAKDIKHTAFHECCELLLARFDVLACYRYSTKSEIEEARHGVIRRLENKIFSRGKK